MMNDNFAAISERLKAIYDCLQDDESRAMFMARINYFFTNDPRYWYDMIESAIFFGSKSKRRFEHGLPLISDFINIPEYKEKSVVLYGAGVSLGLVFPVLKCLGINICAICDSNVEKQGKNIYGYTIIFPEILVKNYKTCYIMITGFFGAKSIVSFLLDAEIPANRIISLVNHAEMYFGPEFITPKENEYYLDIGLHTASTIERFVRFCGMGGVTYRKILAFEPDRACYEKCVKAVSAKGFKNVNIINKGVYSSSGTIGFDGSEAQKGIGKIDKNGGNIIETVTIDELIPDDEVTFIKMDIEGAELEALKGAAGTIRRYKPRLAISIYHKPEDIVNILSYINCLVPEYRFWIRQYSYFGGETVLYALI